jgi:hypothetical protein
MKNQELINEIENTISILHAKIYKARMLDIEINLEIVDMFNNDGKKFPHISAEFIQTQKTTRAFKS